MLNVIFEIEARKQAGAETIIVVDDIADSFDYKNKYAIIHYLKEIADSGAFKQLILTHNFDFFRTIQSRFVNYQNCFMASKDSAGLSLGAASGIKNVFVNDWKVNFFKDAKKRIASIPFIRNIVEFIRGGADPAFSQLTSLLHWKADSNTISEGDLDKIYSTLFGETGTWPDGQRFVFDSIRQQADDCLKAGQGINFENKIVLSIAIRLISEKFLVEQIKDPTFVAKIDANQTPRLLAKFSGKFAGHPAINIIEKVVLMTPENIHLNSFMYEPILDMSDEHLRKLYGEVTALQ